MTFDRHGNPETREAAALRIAIRRGDRIAAIRLAQRAFAAGDLRRTAIVALRNGAESWEVIR